MTDEEFKYVDKGVSVWVIKYDCIPMRMIVIDKKERCCFLGIPNFPEITPAKHLPHQVHKTEKEAIEIKLAEYKHYTSALDYLLKNIESGEKTNHIHIS